MWLTEQCVEDSKQCRIVETCGWKPPHARPVLCHHDHEADEVRSWGYYYSTQRVEAVLVWISLNPFNLTSKISVHIFEFEWSKKSAWFSTVLSTKFKYSLHTAWFVGLSLSLIGRLVCWLVLEALPLFFFQLLFSSKIKANKQIEWFPNTYILAYITYVCMSIY